MPTLSAPTASTQAVTASTANPIRFSTQPPQRSCAGLSSRTIVELLPCVDAPSEPDTDAALERMEQERDPLSEHIADLVRTRESLDGLIACARDHREDLRAAC